MREATCGHHSCSQRGVDSLTKLALEIGAIAGIGFLVELMISKQGVVSAGEQIASRRSPLRRFAARRRVAEGRPTPFGPLIICQSGNPWDPAVGTAGQPQKAVPKGLRLSSDYPGKTRIEGSRAAPPLPRWTSPSDCSLSAISLRMAMRAGFLRRLFAVDSAGQEIERGHLVSPGHDALESERIIPKAPR